MKWKISSSIVRGSIHGSENCQDNNCRIITDDYSMVVACDGASSVSHAYEASRIAADTFEILVKNCNTRLFDMSDDELKSLICGTVRSALIDAATAAGCDIDQFHTTLAAIICTPESYLAVNIGDGLGGVIPDDKNLGGEALLSPVTGEYANTCHFISENDSERHLAIARGKFCTEASYFLLTDGSVHCLYNRQHHTFANALSIYSGWLRDYDFNKAQRAVSRSIQTLFPQLTADDCTLVLLRGER